MRLTINQRDGDECRIRLTGCTIRPTVLDHIVHPKRGGAWFDPDNLPAACKHGNDRRRETTSFVVMPEPTAPSRRL